jgi:hypothetical protein
MRLRQRRFKITPLLGVSLAAGALLWLPASEALSAAAFAPAGPGGGGGPRLSTPNIGSVGPRGPNFRVNPIGPKGNPTTGNPSTGNPTTGNPDAGKPPKGNPEAGRKPPKGPKGPGIVVIPPGAGGQPPAQQFSSPATPFRRIGTGVPPSGETRYVPNEVIIELDGNPSAQVTTALANRFRLTRTESLYLPLTNTTIYRWTIPNPGQRPVPAVIRQLEGSSVIKFASANFVYGLSQSATAPTQASAPADKPEGDPAQYTLGKLRLPLAHGLAKGDQILVAVIDSGVDTTHQEFAGVIADTYDALDPSEPAHAHGTAIAGAIAAQSRLMGVAPSAKILAVRAFGESKGTAEGTTFNILKGLNWAIEKNANVVNMSFAGPQDPALSRSLAAAQQKGVILIAAVGNAGPKSPPLYPAADANVIAVTATDSDDQLFKASNRGGHIAIAAPGVDILLPSPGGSYQVSSGTSFAAAHVSGIAALILERKRDLKPDAIRKILTSSAKDLGPKGRDIYFGAGLADAYQAVTATEAGGPAPSNASASR